jgi:hypothetical protein
VDEFPVFPYSPNKLSSLTFPDIDRTEKKYIHYQINPNE